MIRSLPYSLNALYLEVGVSKQAVNQHFKKVDIWQEKVRLLVNEVDLIRSEHPGCGVEKLYWMLNPNWIGRDKFVALLMSRGYRVHFPKNYRRTTYSIQQKYFPNLIEGMLVHETNQVWQTDITYFMVGDVYCYITFIIDIYSKRIVGCQASKNMRAEANIQALKMAFRSRKGQDLTGMIHHSDRGGQFIDKDYLALLATRGIQSSMCTSAMANAYAERVNGIIKNEYLAYWDIKTFPDLHKCLRKAVKNYNARRPHRHLNRKTPLDFEKYVATLDSRNKPMAIVYAEALKSGETSSLPRFMPEKSLQAHVCPMPFKSIVS
jgi:transposase InsO family protein